MLLCLRFLDHVALSLFAGVVWLCLRLLGSIALSRLLEVCQLLAGWMQTQSSAKRMEHNLISLFVTGVRWNVFFFAICAATNGRICKAADNVFANHMTLQAFKHPSG